LPPLPAAFLDLYASTVRTSTADDPSLHQGRVRQIPHVAGNWPSHVYIEWYPPAAAHALLTSLLSDLQKRAGPSTQISTFLTSDLGVPLPLHISLSRPISLSTAEKDGFLAQLVASISRGSVAPFELSCRGVEWHRTEESGRSFLVLRVQSSSNSNDDTNTTDKNPELTELLRRCNLAAGSHGQPQLYQWATTARDSSAGVERESSKQPKSANVWDAFHLSIAWSFAKPTEELKQVTQAAFSENGGSAKRICETKIPVEGVKVKIGNVVTHVPL
ncbi:U6 snRNA phosphodiesterase Usb1, partial [Bombardia bombarda]